MTCIAGVEHGGRVYIGGDSAGISGYSLRVRADEKVFQNGPFLMGFTSSFRMGQLLHFALSVPEQASTQDDFEFLCTTFVDAVRQCLASGGVKEIDKGVETGGQFLVGYKGRLYNVQADFQVARPAQDCDAVGCGHEIAMGALSVLRDRPPEERVLRALQAAEHFNCSVRGPFILRDIA